MIRCIKKGNWFHLVCLPVIASECNDLTDREHCVKALKASSNGFLWLETGQNAHSADTPGSWHELWPGDKERDQIKWCLMIVVQLFCYCCSLLCFLINNPCKIITENNDSRKWSNFIFLCIIWNEWNVEFSHHCSWLTVTCFLLSMQ